MLYKSESTIGNWVTIYESGDGVNISDRKAFYRKFSVVIRQCPIDLYKCTPILYLDEAKHKFDTMFNTQISRSYICVILREAGLTWNVLERRAIQSIYY
jgi:hypothetical protein